jgi:hypothetical protein
MMAELVVETNEKEALEKEKQISPQESKVEMQLKLTHHTSTPWNNPVVHGDSAALSASSKDLILVEMMNRTHQEKDVRIRCCMYRICLTVWTCQCSDCARQVIATFCLSLSNHLHQVNFFLQVCYFYLESANWNINNAIELLQSMVC